MPEAKEAHGTVFVGGTATLLARIESADGAPVVPSDFGSALYSIYELDPFDLVSMQVVPGHEEVSLDLSDVLSNSLTVSGAWVIDADGHNFRHEIDTTTNTAFPNAQRDYQVRYLFERSGGQPVVIRFKIKAL